MGFNAKQFKADLKRLLVRYKLSAVLVLAHHECDLEIFWSGTSRAMRGMNIVRKRIYKVLDDVQEEVKKAME